MADFEKPSLLPPALAVDLSMRVLEVLIARLVELDLAPTLVYDFEHVAESALPHLGEQFHVMGAEGWRLATTPEQRRTLLARAVALHRHKGTPWSIREALKAVGFNDLKSRSACRQTAMTARSRSAARKPTPPTAGRSSASSPMRAMSSPSPRRRPRSSSKPSTPGNRPAATWWTCATAPTRPSAWTWPRSSSTRAS